MTEYENLYVKPEPIKDVLDAFLHGPGYETHTRGIGDINLRADWKITAFNVESNEIVYSEEAKNLIVRAARKDAIYFLFGLGSTTTFGYMGAGTSGTAAAITDTALGAEITATRKGLTNTSSAGLSTSDVVQETSGGFDQKIIVQGFYDTTDLNGNTIAEYGIFSSSGSGTGTMFNHFIPAASIAKTSAIAITVQVTIRI